MSVKTLDQAVVSSGPSKRKHAFGILKNARGQEADVENTPPSEDGEAMRKNVVSSSSTTGKRWFAVYTTCRHEKRVVRHLQQRQIEHYLPLYRTQHRWQDGSRVMLDLPLFPGYVFVRIDSRDRVGVLAVPGVVSMIGSALRPAPLPDFEVEKLRTGLDPMRAEPHPLVTVGQHVRIKVGALAGVEGIVIRKKSGIRVVLTLSLLMQSIAIEVDSDDVEFVDTSFLPALEATHREKEIEHSQRLSLYQS
ncbi:MAG: UpxY family transcription antiterminator [Terracidiphilus sp.]